jgi:hypothetical protein
MQRLRSALGNPAVRWSVAACCALAAVAVRATPPELPFADAQHAYGLGQVTEARALVRKYLASSEAALQKAKSDEERFAAVSLIQRAALITLTSESSFPLAGRFRNSDDLLQEAERALAMAEGAAIPAQYTEGARNMFATGYRYLLTASTGIWPRSQQAEFFRTHADRLGGAASLEWFFPLADRYPEANTAQWVARVAGKFVRGYGERDAAAISATTRLSAADAASRLKDNDLTFFAGTTDRVSKIAFRPVSGEWVRASYETFLVYLPDLELQLVAPNGTAYSKTVDRALTLYVTSPDKSRLEIRVDQSRAERAKIRY